MKCPVCQTEMGEGRLVAHGSQWLATNTLLDKLLKTTPAGTRLLAYLCPKCGKVELQREPKN